MKTFINKMNLKKINNQDLVIQETNLLRVVIIEVERGSRVEITD